jgi:protein tyrosine/serine phosphatase
MKRLSIGVFLVLIMAPVFALAQDCLPAKEIENFGCVSPRIYRGAQPTEQGVKELARRGVKTIINLRDADENAETEKKWAETEGIKFYNIPFDNWLGPRDKKVEDVLKLINVGGNQPVFIHCKRGADRTGTVIAAYRISHDGWTAKQAKSEAKKYHFGWWQFWMDDFINDYYKKFGKTATPGK